MSDQEQQTKPDGGASVSTAGLGHIRSNAVKDYPEIGVCSWREWSQEAAMWLHDPKNGRAPAGFRMWRFFLRQIRSKPLARNPWRRCFARYSMTPWEAKETIFQRGAL